MEDTPTTPTVDARLVHIPIDGVTLTGDLTTPPRAQGLIVFAHGSGSSRLSPRNRYVAGELQRAHLATLLFDLLTPSEEQADLRTGRLRFDIPFLAERLGAATDWVIREPGLWPLGVGYFGASTGAAAALVAAAQRPGVVRAIVSRGGRPDLAGDALDRVACPTLLIVGGNDAPVIELNREALPRLRGHAELAIVPGATHLFEEPGALEEVARRATRWFAHYLAPQRAARERDPW
ncbi:MAG: dienelactone hydrolase family protein [Gemmatimonadaceae bacterium]|nr:dienelactone hydrolase family protein [Gemmatimonadaceae bacterium]